MKEEFKGLENSIDFKENQYQSVAQQMDSQDDAVLVRTVELYEVTVNNEEDEPAMSSIDDLDIVKVAEMLGL